MPDHANDGYSVNACIVRRFEEGDAKRWDAFVAATPQATFFHLAAWRSIIEGLHHRCHYLYAERQGVVTGILPLAEIHSWLFGHALISTPFCVYGGVVAADPESEACLVQAAAALADELRVDYLELRNREPRQTDWPIKHLYVTFRKSLPSEGIDDLKAIPMKRRNKIRKGINASLETRHDGSVAEFYRVYTESVRNLGTPVLPRRWFERLRRAFGTDCEITMITLQGRPLATVMSFYFRDEVHTYYAGSVRSGRTVAANDFMYWAVMQRALERGVRLFDFGRSKQDTGSYDFKEQWGFQPEPLPYAYHLVRAKEVPNVSPTNRKYHLFIEGWKRLPLPVSRALGPFLARNLG
ncbi:MAG TPA: FemAB family XrtA/PEP-CTERM system-associated protein [Rhodanobacteraceae bacterium]|nr:FemAB family XrtA/PEP-CTERM system-associated protein [Rhodanobacteraceae bacterium]